VGTWDPDVSLTCTKIRFRYEMIIGIPPFYDKNRNKMFMNIETSPVRWPDKQKHGVSVSPEAKDLIMRLLDRNRKSRLG